MLLALAEVLLVQVTGGEARGDDVSADDSDSTAAVLSLHCSSMI